MAAGAALAIVGGGVQAYGQMQAAKAQADAAKIDSMMRFQQANEILSRSEVEAATMFLEGEQFKGRQMASQAASGVQLGAGSTLLALEDTNQKILMGIDNMKRDATFRANQLFAEGKQLKKDARNIKKAGTISAVGSLLSAGGMAAMKGR